MLLLLCMLLPLAGGAVLPLLPLKSDRKRAVFVESVVLVTSGLVLFTLIRGENSEIRPAELMRGMTLAFRTDGSGKAFAGLAAFLWPLATLYAFEYMEHEERAASFFSWYTMTYGVTLGVAFSANLFTMYIVYECLTFLTLPLVTHRQDAASMAAGRKYLVYCMTGAVMGFLSLIAVQDWGTGADFTHGGTLSAEAMDQHGEMLRILFLAGFFGFGTKAAVFPLHHWLPEASVAPTPVTALLHAVAVVNTGAFAVLRLVNDVYGMDFLRGSWAAYAAFGTACFTIVFAGVRAVKEQHWKRKLAWSTVSNLSYMLMGICLMTPGGAAAGMTHMVCHSLMKITLSYCVGAVQVKTGKEYVQEVRGMGKCMPVTCSVFLFAAAALVGLPPLCGFTGKFSLMTAASEISGWMGVTGISVLILSAVLTALYVFPVAFSFWLRKGENLPTEKRDPSWRMLLPLGVLCAAILVLGVYAGPLLRFLKDTAAII